MHVSPEQFILNTVNDGYDPDESSADLLVAVPDEPGRLNYGHISAEIALAAGIPALPIRLRNGRHRGSSGYGVAHILGTHDGELAKVDYWSVQDFVLDVTIHFDVILRSDSSGRLMLVSRADWDLNQHRILVLELDGQSRFYSAVTGYLRDGGRKIKGKLVWERRERSTELGKSSPPEKGQSDQKLSGPKPNTPAASGSKPTSK